MNNIDTLIDFDIIEILLITTIAFIGAFVHRFWMFIYDKHPITFKTWAIILVNMVTVTIISLAISPMLGLIHTRLILLPPLLMGLVGEELMYKLVHIESSAELLDWFLRLFKFRDTPLDKHPEKDEALEKEKNNHRELLEKIIGIDNKIEEALRTYSDTSDPAILLNCYKEVAYEISLVEMNYHKWQDSLDGVIHRSYQDMNDSYLILVKLKNKYDDKVKNNIENRDI